MLGGYPLSQGNDEPLKGFNQQSYMITPTHQIPTNPYQQGVGLIRREKLVVGIHIQSLFNGLSEGWRRPEQASSRGDEEEGAGGKDRGGRAAAGP